MKYINQLTIAERQALLHVLEKRFKTNMNRHEGVTWSEIHDRLVTQPAKLWSLHEMENSGGEPDVVVVNTTSELTFVDCTLESPAGRRSCCYDREGLESRKAHKPKTNAMDLAEAWGITILTESEYRALQSFGTFDTKTSSWLLTPPSIRALGGSIFGDFRFGRVFVYHNGAQSYYAGRGFRGKLIL